MLKGINPLLTGDLLKGLDEMGHHDTIVIADGNFPARSKATKQLVELATDNVMDVVRAVLEVLPVERLPTVIAPATGGLSAIGQEFTKYVLATVMEKDEATVAVGHQHLRPDDFYAAAEKASVIVATHDPRHWGCFILERGVLPDPTAN